MTTAHERDLLDRCLRLEAELARARGIDVPALPKREWGRPARRTRSAIVVTPALITEMRAMRDEGMPAHYIAYRLGCSTATVWKWTRKG